MRRLTAFAALSLAAVSAVPAEAQTRTWRQNGEVLTEGTFDHVKADPRVYEVYLGSA